MDGRFPYEKDEVLEDGELAAMRRTGVQFHTSYSNLAQAMKVGREEIGDAIHEQRKCYFTADVPKYTVKQELCTGWQHYGKCILATDGGITDIRSALALRRNDEEYLTKVDRAFT